MEIFCPRAFITRMSWTVGRFALWTMITPCPLSNCKCCAEGFEGSLLVALGKGLHADGAGIAHCLQRLGDTRIVDLARPGLAAAGVVGHLNLADPRQAGRAPAHQVALADLRVVEVEVDAKLRTVHRRNQ